MCKMHVKNDMKNSLKIMYKMHGENDSFSLSKIRVKKYIKNENKIKLKDATSTMHFYGWEKEG